MSTYIVKYNVSSVFFNSVPSPKCFKQLTDRFLSYVGNKKPQPILLNTKGQLHASVDCVNS